jgi:hypothetical protein
MAQQSFSKTVLEAALAIAEKNGGKATSDEISIALGAGTKQRHKNILNVLSELYCAGRLQRVAQGVYAPPAATKPPEKREVMWRLLRLSRPGVTVDDLVEMAAVSVKYAEEWLRMLARREVVRRVDRPGRKSLWLLVKDSIEMPEDEEKAAKLRTIRRQKKQQITVRLDVISTALGEIRTILNDMEPEL